MDDKSIEEVLCQECGRNHSGSCGIEKVIAALSSNLSKGFEGTTRWSISDTTAGLLKLYNRHAFEGAEDTIIGDEVRDRATLGEIQEWLRWAISAYERDRAALLTSMLEQKLQYQDIMELVATSAINQPAYFIAIYHARQCVVMGIRGTYNATDILTDLNPHTEPFQDGAAHTGILGAAKWLLEKEGSTLQKLLHDHPGYKLVLTGHSLGGAVAALLAMMLHASGTLAKIPTSVASKMEKFVPNKITSKLESNFPTMVGIPSSQIMCWGYGCAPCVDRTIAEETPYIHNVVLQDDVVPRVNPAAFETLRDEIQETSLYLSDHFFQKFMNRRVIWNDEQPWISYIAYLPGICGSQGFKEGKKKKMIETIERVHVAKAFKSGYQKIQNARMERKQTSEDSSNSNSNKEPEEPPPELPGEPEPETSTTSETNMEDPGTEAGIAAQGIMAVAEGPAASKQELESRRLFVPGNLYHIRRRAKEQSLGPPVPVKPFEKGVDAPRNSKFKHHVLRGTDRTSRFGRIILSSTMLSDHGCYNIRDGLLDAVAHLEKEGMQSGDLSNPHVVVE